MSLTVFFIVAIALFIGLIIFHANKVRTLNHKLKDSQWEFTAANASWENEQLAHKRTAQQLEVCQKKCRDKDEQIATLEAEVAPLRVKTTKPGTAKLPVRKNAGGPSKQKVKEDNDQRAANARKKSGSSTSGYASTSHMASSPAVDNTPLYVATAVAVAASSPAYDTSPSSYDCGGSSFSPSCD